MDDRNLDWTGRSKEHDWIKVIIGGVAQTIVGSLRSTSRSADTGSFFSYVLDISLLVGLVMDDCCQHKGGAKNC